MRTTKSLHRFVILAIVFLSACSSPKAAPTTSIKGTISPPYPGSGTTTNSQAYPVPGNSAYPPPNKSSNIKPIAFRLNKPLREGDTTVSGSGPADLPIIISDVTFNGNELAKGTIGSDGKFMIKLANPLEKNHRIGVALGDLSGTQWAGEAFSDPGFFGEEYQQIPMVGFFYDTTMVQPK
jgi:hypothetical protein